MGLLDTIIGAFSGAPDAGEIKAQQESQLKALYSPKYAEEYRKRQLARFGEELPAAELMAKGMQTGETSSALAAQRLGMGQTAAQQAVAAASGANPMAARQAMFGAAQLAGEVAQRGAGARFGEIGKAQQALTEAQLRQMGYAQQVAGEDLRRRQMLQRAIETGSLGELQAQMQEQARARQFVGGLANMAAQAATMGAGSMPKAGG